MGKNKKEAFIFTAIMCTFMVLFMSIYNVVLFTGWTSSVITEVAIGFVPALIVGLFMDVVVVSKVAKGIAFKLIKPTDPTIKKVLTISFFMVCGMVLCMSLYGTLAHYGFSGNFLAHYFSTAGLNFICALPLQFIIVGPLTRFLFMRIFPVQVYAAA